MARVRDLAAVMAHEIKNPVTGISGALHIIARRLPEGSREQAVLRDIQERLGRLDALIDDLVAYAEARPRTLVRVNLADIVHTAIVDFQEREGDLGTELQLDLADAYAVADVEGVRNAVASLLSNAIRAAGSAGRVHVRLRMNEAYATISVTDDGPGIPERLRLRVFDPFFTTDHLGTGLGLALVARVARAHSGEVDIECPEGGGTTVSLSLRIGARALSVG